MCDFEIVSATRKNEESFWRTSLLAASINEFRKNYDFKYHIFYENKRSLSAIYNQAISRSEAKYIILVHDDVYIKDMCFFEKLIEEHKLFNILGVAGCLSDVGVVPAWPYAACDFSNKKFTKLNSRLGGRIYHGAIWINNLNVFGDVGVQATLLDGVFISIDLHSIDKNLRLFDEGFDFHFYDLDFSKNAVRNGMKLGISSVELVHESTGGYFSESWIQAYEIFKNKWENR